MASSQSLSTRKRIYRKRVKASHCRSKDFTKCRKRNGCKYTARGKKAGVKHRGPYCRKRTNRAA